MQDKLTVRQARFALEFTRLGNATQAAIAAGYATHTATTQAARLLTKAHVQTAISEQSKVQQSATIADAQERKAFWTTVMRGEESELKDRLKASELLGKAGGDFIERREQVGDTTVRVIYENVNDAGS